MIRKLLLTFVLAGSTVLCISAITAREIVDRIIKKSVNAPFPQTVDVFKEGNPDDEVTGIAVCMFASMDVLRDAVKNKCNFVITHEPLYYNHLDATSQFKDDPVVNEKKKFITENHLIVWRFHDYLHSINPDPVLTAMADKLGWKDYCSTTSPYEYQLPSTTLKAVISHLKKKIPGVSFDVVGNPATKISKVIFAPGSPGSMTHIRAFNEKKADLVISGEVQQWETYEYVRDAVAQGKNKAIIFLGHFSSEDPGMEATPKWLKTFITEVPVKFLESGPSYVTY
jgi:putative NIF3 family GTP cyclohydrolase 1 type 2